MADSACFFRHKRLISWRAVIKHLQLLITAALSTDDQNLFGVDTWVVTEVTVLRLRFQASGLAASWNWRSLLRI
jgi:hypothetical protein